VLAVSFLSFFWFLPVSVYASVCRRPSYVVCWHFTPAQIPLPQIFFSSRIDHPPMWSLISPFHRVLLSSEPTLTLEVAGGTTRVSFPPLLIFSGGLHPLQEGSGSVLTYARLHFPARTHPPLLYVLKLLKFFVLDAAPMDLSGTLRQGRTPLDQ